MLKRVLIIAIFCGFLMSCSTHKNLNYFTQSNVDSTEFYRQIRNIPIQIQPGDKLSIYVTALNQASAQPYNLSQTNSINGASSTYSIGYTVDSAGRILFPQLGFLKIGGMTKNELRDTLLNRLKIYLMAPTVTIDFLNFKVTVLGEVAKPGVLNISDGKINILEALGQAGDLTMYGKRENILVIREDKDHREFGHINLTSKETFLSPYYTLKQNDIVYVEMIDKKPSADEQQKVRNITLITSVIAVASTLGLLLVNIFK